MKKDLISIRDLSNNELESIFELTHKVKRNPKKFANILRGKTLGLIFQKPSNRTRVSFEIGMYQLGGYAVYLGPDDIELGARESTKDIAQTLSRYLDGILARTFSHQDIIDLANYATIPVINGLSDLLHPCQALADLFTIREKLKKQKNIKVAFIGDGNNVLHSLLFCCAKSGINLSIATPRGYEPDRNILKEAELLTKKSRSYIKIERYAKDAAASADVVYTDVWTSMGQEAETKRRQKDFNGFQINSKLMKFAKGNALIMHCLPAHRGEEITDDVIDSKHSVVFDQAENRLHIQKAVLIKLLK